MQKRTRRRLGYQQEQTLYRQTLPHFLFFIWKITDADRHKLKRETFKQKTKKRHLLQWTLSYYRQNKADLKQVWLADFADQCLNMENNNFLSRSLALSHVVYVGTYRYLVALISTADNGLCEKLSVGTVDDFADRHPCS